MVEELIPVLDPGRIVVLAFATAAENGVGSAMAERTLLIEITRHSRRLPIVFWSRGHTTGGKMLMIAVADLATATSQSTFELSVTLDQPLGIAPVALRRRVKSCVIRRWVFL